MTNSNKDKDFLTLVAEYRRERNWQPTKVQAMLAIMKENPNSHRAYLEAAQGRGGQHE